MVASGFKPGQSLSSARWIVSEKIALDYLNSQGRFYSTLLQCEREIELNFSATKGRRVFKC